MPNSLCGGRRRGGQPCGGQPSGVRERAVAVLLTLLSAASLLVACSTRTVHPDGGSSGRAAASTPGGSDSAGQVPSGAPSSDALPSGSPSSGPSSGPTSPSSGGPTSPPAPPVGRVSPQHGQLTPRGLWWGVDSTTPISDASLANVRSWYVGSPKPLVWGRYIGGTYTVTRAELAFARAHGIAVYLVVPDRNCSVCDGGGDVCGADHTAEQARSDATAAVRAADRTGVPARVTLFKDIEQIGSCTGELSAEYLRAWYDTVRRTQYRVGFYGNSNRQFYDFPRAYCAAVRGDPRLRHDVILAQDEPEPAISAPAGTIGPGTAPRFAPYVPSCAPRAATKIWQYGESTTSGNVTDVDEIIPGTPGLIAPDGTAT